MSWKTRIFGKKDRKEVFEQSPRIVYVDSADILRTQRGSHRDRDTNPQINELNLHIYLTNGLESLDIKSYYRKS